MEEQLEKWEEEKKRQREVNERNTQKKEIESAEPNEEISPKRQFLLELEGPGCSVEDSFVSLASSSISLSFSFQSSSPTHSLPSSSTHLLPSNLLPPDVQELIRQSTFPNEDMTRTFLECIQNVSNPIVFLEFLPQVFFLNFSFLILIIKF